MKKVLNLVLFLPFFVTAQEKMPADGPNKGAIHFEEGLLWKQVKEKARMENKFIFVDCFATWCGPCKMMDKNVYSQDSVGEIINKNFISVKVQCDTSKNDNEMVQKWYADAHTIASDYFISAYPTFLFLSPDGKIVHKGVGYLRPYEFVNLCNGALDPDKQYYTLLKDYQDGKRDYGRMPYLAGLAKTFNDYNVANTIAADYAAGYLDKLNDANFCIRENLTFFSEYRQNIHSTSRIFAWYFRHSQTVDSIMQQKGYSKGMVNYVVYKENLTPQLAASDKTKKTPNWKKIEGDIKKDFGEEYVEGNLLKGKVNWYRSVEDWKNYTHYLVMKLDRDSVEKIPKNINNMLVLNYNAWEVFQHSDDEGELQKALEWVDLAINMNPRLNGNIVDTKANLLYKLGKREEALVLEAKAVELMPQDKGIQEAYRKMQEEKKTW